jgi:peptidoglycan/LPS O-acetylase OafA/YrhL
VLDDQVADPQQGPGHWARLALTLRQGLTRITSSGEFIPQVDGLRFLGMQLVLAHHVFAAYLEQTHRLGTEQLPRDWAVIAERSPLVNWVLHLGIGVPLFFVISGFVLAIPFARRYFHRQPPPSWKAYLIRRLIRIEPPYILNMLVMFLIIVIPWHQADPLGYFRSYFKAFAPHLFASLAYLHAAIFGDASWINGVAWTFEVEIQFYLLLPFLAILFGIRPTLWRRTLFALLILASALLSQFVLTPAGNARINLSLAVQLHYFLAGILLADFYLEPAWKLGPRTADALAFLASALLIYVLHWDPSLAWAQAFLLAGGCLMVLQGRWTHRWFQHPVLAVVGGMSYTIYLYHFLIIRLLMPFTVRLFPPQHALWWDVSVQFLLMWPPILAVSAVVFWTTERPFMILSREVMRRLRTGTT